MKATTATKHHADDDAESTSFPMNPYYASASPILVATDEESDIDIPSNSCIGSTKSSTNPPIAIPIQQGYSTSSLMWPPSTSWTNIPLEPALVAQVAANSARIPSRHQPTATRSSSTTAIVFASPVVNNEPHHQQKQYQQQQQVSSYTTANKSGKAMAALTWAIFGLVLCPVTLGMVLGPRAICLAVSAKKEIRALQKQQSQSLQKKGGSGMGMANWAIFIGLVDILISIGVLVVTVLLFLPRIKRFAFFRDTTTEPDAAADNAANDGNDNNRHGHSYDYSDTHDSTMTYTRPSSHYGY